MLGPDASRYWHAAGGGRVPRPFRIRWLLPKVCGHNEGRWWFAWFAGWVLAAVGMFGWVVSTGASWQLAGAASVLLLGLPGFLGPGVTIPIGVDIPATGLTLCGVALCGFGWWPVGVVLIAVAATIRETSPVWAALWLWSAWPLLALVVPLVAFKVIRSGPDPLGPRFQHIADHPVSSALRAHRGQWRNAWVMVAPWGVCLVGLGSPSWPLVAVLVLAYAQLLVATDTVRLVHHAAGPVLAVAAVQGIPVEWLLLAVVVHVAWWRVPERV